MAGGRRRDLGKPDGRGERSFGVMVPIPWPMKTQVGRAPLDAGTVLIVDDEPFVTDGLRRGFRHESFRLLTASSADEAMEILGREQVDIVVSDEQMPGRSGVELLTDLARTRPDILRMMLTGKADVSTLTSAINQACLFRIFIKPCNMADLASTLRQAFAQKALQAEQIRLRQELAHTQERYELATSAGNVGVWDWDLAAGELYLTPQFERMLGLPKKPDLEPWQSLDALIHPEDRTAFMSQLDVFRSERPTHFRTEQRMVHGDGTPRWILIQGRTFLNDEGQPVRMAGSGTDISDLKRLELELRNAMREAERLAEEMRTLSRTDGLTGIANRRHFDEHLTESWGRAARYGQALSILLFDVDHFKRYNDHFGHLEGDRCLKQVVEVMSLKARRAGDLVARYGGEEFVVVQYGTDLQAAEACAQQIRMEVAALKLPHPASDVCDVVTLSGGVASTMPQSGDRPELLIASADECLYIAKETGRNRIASHQVHL